LRIRVTHSHRRQIDLSLHNILIWGASKDPHIKIILDPRFACTYDLTGQTFLTQAVGSTYFPAPELIRRSDDIEITYRGPEIDVWNFGVILFIMVVGRVPFDAETIEALHQKLRNGKIDWSAPRLMNGPGGLLLALGSQTRSWFSSLAQSNGRGGLSDGELHYHQYLLEWVNNECLLACYRV